MTDNVAVLEGFTKEVTLENDQVTLYLLIKPETDLNDAFKAWDTDMQEFITVYGWLF